MAGLMVAMGIGRVSRLAVARQELSPSSMPPSIPSIPPSSRREPPARGAAAMMRSARRENGSVWRMIAAWSGELDEEQSFAAKQRGLHSRNGLDVVVDRWLERDEAARVDVEHLTRSEIHRVQRAAGMQEHEAVAGELLQDESLAAEETGTELDARKRCSRRRHARRTRNAFFCAMSVPPISPRSMGWIFPGYGAANATSRRRFDSFVNHVTKNESPERTRLPADMSLSNSPPPRPVMSRLVAMRMPSCMYIMPPASATTASPGSSVTITP